jgi:prophage regulatory protein
MHTAPALSPTKTGTEPGAFLRMHAVIRYTGLARSTIYRLVAQNKFPAPFKLADRAVAWRRADLEAWVDARPRTEH